MPIHIRNLEWLDHNSERSYPLTVESAKRDQTGSFTLPDDFIVSLYLAVSVGINVDPTKFYIRSLGNHATGFGITIGYESTGGPVNVATANIARVSHSPNQAYRLTGIGDFVEATGWIVLGALDGIDNQLPGQFEFEAKDTRLEPDVVRPMIRAVTALQVRNGASLSEYLYGVVTLEAGTNMRITVVKEAGLNTRIVFDAIEGEGLNEECVCEDEDAPPIRTINGIPGTLAGDFTLLGNNCLVARPIQNGLRLDDVCSEPCCGCVELETITQQLEQFGRQATTLENFLVALQARVTQMDQVVLGARLGDRGCVTCE